VVDRHDVFLAAFLVQPELPPLALGEVIVDLERKRGADACERIDEHTDERAVAEAADGVGVDRIQKLSGLLTGEDGRLATFHDVLRPADGVRRVGRHDLADHKPIGEHPYGGEFLLDAGLRAGLAALLDERPRSSG